jgi:hypothetical protein
MALRSDDRIEFPAAVVRFAAECVAVRVSGLLRSNAEDER